MYDSDSLEREGLVLGRFEAGEVESESDEIALSRCTDSRTWDCAGVARRRQVVMKIGGWLIYPQFGPPRSSSKEPQRCDRVSAKAQGYG